MAVVPRSSMVRFGLDELKGSLKLAKQRNVQNGKYFSGLVKPY